eukprot:comp24100_c1_seq1/m.43516 comp24100_c1_seq1/g.43516  ORF comp24100_c1_seq1/g.43516 comp24100_c1_seq1/m.43516 type:complete len:578 (+) comp24100_c1_seq1:3557-5290(+)
MAHTRPEVCDAAVSLLGPAQVRLGNKHVSHGQHAQPSKLLGRVEHHGRETGRHFRVETDLHTGLDLVLALDEKVQKLLCVDHSLSVVRHKADQGCVPLVDDLCERGGPRGHQDLTDAVVELLKGVVVHPEERLCCSLLGDLVLEIPDTIAVDQLLPVHADLGHDAHLKARHVEQDRRVILAENGDEAVVPVDGCDGPRQTVFHVPEHSPAQVHVVLHQAHALVTWPALLVVVAHDVLVVGVGVLRQVLLDQVPALLGREPEEDVHTVDVARVQTDRVPYLRLHILIGEEVVWHLGGPSHLACTVQTQKQNVKHQPVVLHDECCKLQTSDQAVRVSVVHVLVVDDHVVLGRHVVGNVVVHNKTQQTIQQRQIHLLVEFVELGLEHDVALAFRGVPHILQVIDALAPLVHEEWWGLCVCGLDPWREQPAFVGLIPEVLVEVCIRDLFERLNLVDGDEVAVEIHELDLDLLEGPLGQQVTLDARQRLVRVVVCLLHKPKLLTLGLIEATCDAVCLLQPFQCQNEQLCVVLVGQGGEGDGGEPTALQPVHHGGVHGYGLFRRDVRTVLVVVVLALLLSLEI